MKTSTGLKPNLVLALGIPCLIFLSCFLITLTTKFKTNTDFLSNAILIDLLIVAPLVYFLVIRKSSISKLSVSRIFIAGLLVAGFILHDHPNQVLQITRKWISPILEAFIIYFIWRKFYTAGRNPKKTKTDPPDFLQHCREVMFRICGNEKFGNIISSEIAVLYYAFVGGKRKEVDYKTRFTSYKENGIVLVLWAILSIFLIETAGMHFLLDLWSKTIAWIISALSFYTCIQLYAHIRAIGARPACLNEEYLEIHNGLAGDAYIMYNNIEKFELSKKIPTPGQPFKLALIKGLENHNVVLYLKSPVVITKIFGIKKSAQTILFYIDKENEFSDALAARLEKYIEFAKVAKVPGKFGK